MNITLKTGYEISAEMLKSVDIGFYQYKNIRTDEIVTTILLDRKNRKYILPRNSVKLQKAISNIKNTINFTDERLVKSMDKAFALKKDFILRDYQKKAANLIYKNLKNSIDNACILQAKTGSGKTYQLPAIVKKLNQKTLILVDRTNLVTQMYKEFKQNADGDIQVLSKQSQRVADVNISTIQLLLKNKNLLLKLKKEIGFVVLDEAHIVSVGSFTEIITSFSAKYRLAMTATPTRSDGLTGALYDHFSYNKVIGDNPNLLSVKFIVVKHKKSIFYMGKFDAGQAWRDLYSDLELTTEITKLAIKLLNEKKRAVFVYCTNQKGQELLKALFKKDGYSTEVINAKTKKTDREAYIEAFNERKLDFIISGVILQKGISIHRMDTIINFSNHTKESFEQAAGRLRREHKDKNKPLFITFCWEGKGMWKCMEQDEWVQKLCSSYKDTLKVLSYTQFKNFIEK